jgi:hypothetical protein
MDGGIGSSGKVSSIPSTGRKKTSPYEQTTTVFNNLKTVNPGGGESDIHKLPTIL